MGQCDPINIIGHRNKYAKKGVSNHTLFLFITRSAGEIIAVGEVLPVNTIRM